MYDKNENKPIKHAFKKSTNDRPGMLSDTDIRSLWGEDKDIFITTNHEYEIEFNIDKQLQLGSIDLHFGHEYHTIKPDEVLDYQGMKDGNYVIPHHLKKGEFLHLKPGEMILTTTLEQVRLSKRIAGFVTGRSSVARLGVMVQCCQDFINPGHGQTIPLQIINLSPSEVVLDLNVPICQIVLFRLRTPASAAYVDENDSKYKNEISPITSKLWEESEHYQIEQQKNKVYIASRYKRKEQNNQIHKRLLKENIDSFLPESIKIDGITDEQKQTVAEKCFSEIDKCNIILAVCPFGKSVSAELGYAICRKRDYGNKIIIAYNMDFDDEAMLYPYVDESFYDLGDIINYIKTLEG